MMENQLLIVIIAILLSAFFSGIEIAFISANRLKIEVDKKNRLFSGRVLSGFIRNPSDFVTTLLLGNTIVVVLYGSAIASLFEPILQNWLPYPLNSDFMILIAQTILSTFLILVFAEFIPKTFFRLNANKMLKLFILPIFLFYYLLYPIQFIFVEIAEFILEKIFRIKLSREQYVFSHADLGFYIREYAPAGDEGDKMQPELEMFRNAIGFRNIRVRECAVPRNEIIAVSDTASVELLMSRFVETKHSKIMIYRKNIDNIVGYVHSFDLFSKPKSIREVLRPALIVPHSMMAADLLRMFIQQHRSVAVVVDEFGGTFGLVTMEDLIEEITGEIEDEFDTEALTEKINPDGSLQLAGRLEIDYLNDRYKLGIPVDENYETLAGYIIHHLERIPRSGELVTISPFEIRVLMASNTRIELVCLRMNAGD